MQHGVVEIKLYKEAKFEMDVTTRWPSWAKRTLRHMGFAIIGTVIIQITSDAAHDLTGTGRMSIGAAYAGLIFLAASLMVGPFYVMAKKSLPLSSYLRRDLGIWAAIWGLVHTFVGLTVYFPGQMLNYFIFPPEALKAVPVRLDLFGAGNYIGLGAAILLLILLGVSSNKAIARLTPEKWKNLQQWSYTTGILVVLHGILYQLYEGRIWAFVIAFGLIIAVTLEFQLLGFWLRSRKPKNPQKK